MNKLATKLHKDITDLMIPEVEAYLNDLHTLLEKKEQTPDDMKAIEEMETFLVELQNIIYAIEEEKLSIEQLEELDESIQDLISQSK